jgi:hypothetical protein
VFGDRPVRDELNVPVPVPLLVFVVKAIVRFSLVDHTTPLAVISAPPSEEIFPPEVAVVDVIAKIEEVVTVNEGTVVEFVIKITWFP